MAHGLSARLLARIKLGRLVLPERLPVASASLTVSNVTLPVMDTARSPSKPSVLPTSFASSMRTFASATKAAVSSPFQAKEVVRNSDGKIVGPPSQYILSALNHNKTPFTRGTASRMFIYFTLLYGMMKTGVLNSPVDLISAADDFGDSVVHLVGSAVDGHPEWHTNYFNGFTQSAFKCDTKNKTDVPGLTCYAPGGTYYTQAAADPHYAQLWGYGENLSPTQRNFAVALALFGGVAAFAFANRRTLNGILEPRSSTEWQELGVSAAKFGAITTTAAAFITGVSREVAHPAAMGVMITAGLGVLTEEYRQLTQQVEGAKAIPWKYALPIGVLWLGVDVLYRALADSAGLYQFTPNGHETIYGNWLEWRWKFNTPQLTAAIVSEMFLMAPIWARSSGFVFNTVDVMVAGLSRLIHADKATTNPVRQWLQAAVPQLTPKCDVVSGLELPDYTRVRPDIQAFTKAEKITVKSGTMPHGVFAAGVGHSLTVGAALLLWNEGVDSLASLLAGKSHHTAADAVLALLGVMTAGVLVDAGARNGTGRQIYGRIASLLGHQFGPRGRGLYWFMYTLFATASSASIGIAQQAIQGFEDIDGYYKNIGERSLVNPWVNRLVAGARTAYRPEQPIYMFDFFAPGFLTLYSGMEYSKQTAQSPHLLYKMYARDFSLSTDPARRTELLGEMTVLEAFVREAVTHNGYGRPETLERANATLAAITEDKVTYGVPAMPSQSK